METNWFIRQFLLQFVSIKSGDLRWPLQLPENRNEDNNISLNKNNNSNSSLQNYNNNRLEAPSRWPQLAQTAEAGILTWEKSKPFSVHLK